MLRSQEVVTDIRNFYVRLIIRCLLFICVEASGFMRASPDANGAWNDSSLPRFYRTSVIGISICEIRHHFLHRKLAINILTSHVSLKLSLLFSIKIISR